MSSMTAALASERSAEGAAEKVAEADRRDEDREGEGEKKEKERGRKRVGERIHEISEFYNYLAGMQRIFYWSFSSPHTPLCCSVLRCFALFYELLTTFRTRSSLAVPFPYCSPPIQCPFPLLSFPFIVSAVDPSSCRTCLEFSLALMSCICVGLHCCVPLSVCVSNVSVFVLYVCGPL